MENSRRSQNSNRSFSNKSVGHSEIISSPVSTIKCSGLGEGKPHPFACTPQNQPAAQPGWCAASGCWAPVCSQLCRPLRWAENRSVAGCAWHHSLPRFCSAAAGPILLTVCFLLSLCPGSVSTSPHLAGSGAALSEACCLRKTTLSAYYELITILRGSLKLLITMRI